MSRYFNFLVLVAVIVLLAVMFYRVMATFLVPLFMAVLLVVIFRPLHVWFLKLCKDRAKTAALLTTSAILLLVLAPLTLLFVLAANEGQTALRRFTPETMVAQGLRLRDSLKLTIPAVEEMRDVESHLIDVSNQVASMQGPDELSPHIKTLWNSSQRFADVARLPKEAAELKLGSALNVFASTTKEEYWSQFLFEIEQLRDTAQRMKENESVDTPLTPESSPPDEITVDNSNAAETTPTSTTTEGEDHPEAKVEDVSIEQVSRDSIRAFDSFRSNYCGGKSWTWLKLMANPTPEEVEKYQKSTALFLREQLLSLGGATTAFLGRLIFGIVIMIISLYFFLLDGPKMIEGLKHLSPLDEEHEQELIYEFDRVSRAVVVATLLAALAQGALAGIGFYFAGLDNVFLLTMLTVCFAMVPFFGAAAIWVPASLWLYFIENRMGAAIGLAIYGSAVVSMVDNFIKPYVLHGQSNIHPLVALLSVLGGVTALGPIGILIGPMIVVFLQTVLNILQRELKTLDKTKLASDGIGALEQPSMTEKKPTQNPEKATHRKKKS